MGPRTPGLPLTNQPGNTELLSEPQFSHPPNGKSCTNLLDSSENKSQGVWHTGGAQNEVLPPEEGLEGTSGDLECLGRNLFAFLSPPAWAPLERMLGGVIRGPRVQLGAPSRGGSQGHLPK